MADSGEEYFDRRSQEQILMCQKHDKPTDISCEDCENVICSTCVKEEHRDHDWNTLSTAAVVKRKTLSQFIENIENDYIAILNEKIQSARKEIKENEERCDTEVSRVYKTRDKIAEKIDILRKEQETAMRSKLKEKNSELRKTKSNLEEKKKNMLMGVNSLKTISSTMSDIVLIKTHRELMRLISCHDDYHEMSIYSLRYVEGPVNSESLKDMIGQLFDSEEITLTEINSFQWNDKPILMLKGVMHDGKKCVVQNEEGLYFKVNKKGETEMQIQADLNANYPADKAELLAIVPDRRNKCIGFLSDSGYVSSALSTGSFEPLGVCFVSFFIICISLKDTVSDDYRLSSRSRRLVRFAIGNTIDEFMSEYEYEEDGNTRLFTLPSRVAVNGITNDSNICVINRTGEHSGELVILPIFGPCKSTVYRGHNLRTTFNPTDVVCDPHSNIIVNDVMSNAIHLLNPDGKFLRTLLSESQIYRPLAMSLNESVLWIGDQQGHVKIFQYEFTTLANTPTLCQIL